MFKNYLRVALRHLFKNKSYVIINTLGLGIALACCITSYLLIAYNIEFDDFHKEEKVENIFRVHTQILFKDGNIRQATGASAPLGPMAALDVAGIKRFSRFAMDGASVSTEKPPAFNEQVAFADSTFFEMFDFPLVAGNHRAFKDRMSIFINEELATKYFGDEDPIGKILTLSFARGVQKKVTVGGVIGKVPLNSSIFFGAVIRMEHFEEMRLLEQQPWQDWNIPSIYFELVNPMEASHLAQQFDKYIPIRNEANLDQVVQKYYLEPFKKPVDIDNLSYASRPYMNTRIETETLVIFCSMALLILLIACFNLTNTSIAMTANRLKEIGVRKSIGAQKGQIIFQFMLETFIVMTISVLVGYGMSQFIVEKFTTMWEFPYGLEDISLFNLMITLVLISLLASVLAGIYPAFFNSKFNAVALLKGTVRIKGTNILTRTLVSLQFAISVMVLIAGVAFMLNTKYQEQIQFGYDKDQIISFGIQSDKEFFAMEAKALANPKIKNIAVADHHVGWNTYRSSVRYENADFDIKHMGVGKNYFETMGFKFINGRGFDTSKASEVVELVVITKECVKVLNMQGDPIGQELLVHGNKRKVIGVIDDFVDNIYQSKDPEPFVMYVSVEEYWKRAIVKADKEDLAETNEYLQDAWNELYPTKPYESRFQEDILLEGTRHMNANMRDIFLFLTILGGVLSASGIFSLASLNIAKRTKEIGIRKALGASVSNVVMLLNREFVIILIVAGILGSVGGYFGTDALLASFYAYYKPANTITIVLCALFIIAIGLSTTSLTIRRAAKANPVDTLRDE